MSTYLESIGEKPDGRLERVFLASFDEIWDATLEALKNQSFEITSKEAGFLQTKWVLNTKEKNEEDAIEASYPYVKAQYRIQIQLLEQKGQGVLVTLRRQQLVMRDMLEGWHAKESDLIEEQTLLYRIGRLIWLRKKVREIDDKKAQTELQKGLSN
jgi:hypothetical protein